MKLKRYKHECGRTFTCLHCEVLRIVVLHEWVGKPTHAQKKRMIIRDLRQAAKHVAERYVTEER